MENLINTRRVLPLAVALSLVFCKGKPTESATLPDDSVAIANVVGLTHGVSGTVKNAVHTHKPRELLPPKPTQATPPRAMPPPPAPTKTPAPTTPKTPEAHETANSPEYLKKILKVYRYVLGPGHKTRGFFRIDITNNFKPYGPNPEDAPDASVPAFYGSKRYATFEQKFNHSQQEYKDGTLLGKTAAAFDLAFAKSKLKNLLKTTGSDQYFRDLVIYGLVSQESGWVTNVRSGAGATGLFQAMDYTIDHMVHTGKLSGRINPKDPEESATFAVALFDSNLEYLIDAVGPKSFLFKGENVKNVLVPLILTSFNAGRGRLERLSRYFTELHEAGSIPDEFYLNKNTPIFNDNAFLYLCSRGYTLTGTNRKVRRTRADLEFENNNGGFGPDGAQYALKIMATAQLFMRQLGIQSSEPISPSTPLNQIPPNCRPDGIDRNGDLFKTMRTTRERPTLVEILEASGVDVPGWDPRDGVEAIRELWRTSGYEYFIGPIKTYSTGDPKGQIKLGDPFYVPGSYFQKCPNLSQRR